MAKYILKQAAISALINEANTHNNPVKRAYTRAAAIIEQITAEDVQPMKHGRWLHDRRTQWKCSKCGNFLDFDGLNCGRGSAFYCPNCGARMDGDTD